MTPFIEQDHARLATLFEGVCANPDMCPGDIHATRYAGYKPAVREAPNGDTKECPVCKGTLPREHWIKCPTCHGTGRVPNVDDGRAAKRWLHVAPKYHAPDWANDYYDRAFAEACRVATALGVPAAYRPHEAYGALRVLEYPSAGHVPDADGLCAWCGHNVGMVADLCPALAPGAGTAEHKDFDLFTIVLWRSHPADLELVTPRTGWPEHSRESLARTMSPGLHIGELGELVGLGPATPHRVPARPYVQKSLIYFAIPDHGARLPWIGAEFRGEYGWPTARTPTVGEWLDERVKRSRYEAGK